MNFEWLIFLGVAVGLISSVIGLGGGILLVPLLPSVTSLSQKESIATSLFTIFLVVSVNTWRFHKVGLVRWRYGLWLGAFSALGAVIAAAIARQLDENSLIWILSGVLILAFLRAAWPIDPAKLGSEIRGQRKTRIAALVGLGFLAGAISGFCGIGSGLVIGPLLITMQWVQAKEVAPTANAVMIWSTGWATLVYGLFQESKGAFSFGYVHWDVGLLVFLVASLTAIAGRRWQSSFKESWRRATLLALLGGLVIKTLLRLQF